MKKYKNRNEVPEKYKWKLDDFFKDEEDYEKSYKKAVNELKNFDQYHGCTKDANRLYQYLRKFVDVWALCQDLYVYSYLVND